MARIELKQPGQAVADFSVNGHHIIIAGVLVDCQSLQNDSAQIIEVRLSERGAHIGGEGAYLAHIEIPAKAYAEAVVGEGDVVERVAQDLDANAITVTLWPVAN